ncbi:MAG: amino acid ABC transporter permease [Anaerotignaceae bacterium]
MFDILAELFSYIFEIAEGLDVTLSVFGVTILASIPLGVLIAICRLSKNRVLSNVSKFYIWAVRGTPLLLQIIIVFFGLPSIGLTFNRMPAAYLAFTLNYAAYFGEIFRSGIQSIERGQLEAAKVLGFRPKQIYQKIILPQMVKRTLPSIGNEVITLVKDTSLVYILGVNDILKLAKVVGNREVDTLVAFFAAGILYLVMTFVITKLFEVIEKKVHYEE